MKGKGILAAILAALLCLMTACAAGAEGQPKNTLTIYEGPKTMESSKTASVRVNGYELFVYDVMVNHEHIWDTPMTYFDFSGKVRVEIEMPGLEHPVESAAVLPTAAGIVPETMPSGVMSRLVAGFDVLRSAAMASGVKRWWATCGISSCHGQLRSPMLVPQIAEMPVWTASCQPESSKATSRQRPGAFAKSTPSRGPAG